MAASPPAPRPMSAAARQPAGKLFARARRKIPDAVDRLITKATRAPKNRSNNQPTPTRPSRLEPPSIDAHSAAPLAVIPRSVNKADIWVIAPFMLIELTHRTATIIQKAKERRPCCHVIPECATGADWGWSRPRL